MNKLKDAYALYVSKIRDTYLLYASNREKRNRLELKLLRICDIVAIGIGIYCGWIVYKMFKSGAVSFHESTTIWDILVLGIPLKANDIFLANYYYQLLGKIQSLALPFLLFISILLFDIHQERIKRRFQERINSGFWNMSLHDLINRKGK